jgi:hypothetical protein
MHQLRSPSQAAPGQSPSAPSRELALRQTGSVEVRLLWDPEADRVEVSLHDSATDAGFHVDVAPGDALDAFYHPYAYAPGHATALLRVVEAQEAHDA